MKVDFFTHSNVICFKSCGFWGSLCSSFCSAVCVYTYTHKYIHTYMYELYEYVYIYSVQRKWGRALYSVGSHWSLYMLTSTYGKVDTAKPWLPCACACLFVKRHPRPVILSIYSHLSLPSSGIFWKKSISCGLCVNPFRNECIFLFLGKRFTFLHPNPVTSPSSTLSPRLHSSWENTSL